jgi:hypothetical protein
VLFAKTTCPCFGSRDAVAIQAGFGRVTAVKGRRAVGHISFGGPLRACNQRLVRPQVWFGARELFVLNALLNEATSFAESVCEQLTSVAQLLACFVFPALS